MNAETPAAAQFAARLSAQAGWLRMLCAHLAGKRVRDHVELDDLVQETLLRAVGSSAGAPRESEGESALQAWLATLAKHVVIDVVRSLRAARRDGQVVRLARGDWSTTGLSMSRLAADTPGPATRVGADDEVARLMAAYDRLAAEHRRVIGLRHLEGLSARETARRMGRSETAVHSLYRRALAAWGERVGD
jgi:RNA polymerase sigma factor (sigma-70 family)